MRNETCFEICDLCDCNIAIIQHQLEGPDSEFFPDRHGNIPLREDLEADLAEYLKLLTKEWAKSDIEIPADYRPDVEGLVERFPELAGKLASRES